MGWMRYVFLESAMALSVPVAIVLFVLLVWWRRGGSPRPLMIGLAIAGLLFVVQLAVETRRETAIRILKPIEAEVLTAQVDALAASLSDNFQCEGKSAGEFVDFCRERLRAFRVSWLRNSEITVIRSERDRFVIRARYQADVRGGELSGVLGTTWEVGFERSADGWKIYEIVPVAPFRALAQYGRNP
jgi:hypothetical protein